MLIGDSGVGKRSLIITFTKNAFPHDYIPSVMHPFSVNVMADNKQVDPQSFGTASLSCIFFVTCGPGTQMGWRTMIGCARSATT
jgi:GTPase SAR1 family protein